MTQEEDFWTIQYLPVSGEQHATTRRPAQEEDGSAASHLPGRLPDCHHQEADW